VDNILRSCRFQGLSAEASALSGSRHISGGASMADRQGASDENQEAQSERWDGAAAQVAHRS
jgi:hypothetical protein